MNIEGSEGQLFSVTNNLSSGSIFAVNDITGLPSVDVNADGTIQLAPRGAGELVGIGTTAPTSKVHIVGDTIITGVATAGIVTATHIFADRYHGDTNNNFYAGPFTGSGAAGITSGATANIGIGLSLGTKISSGYRNILFGVCSGPEITTGYKNILIGCNNARSLSTGQNNIALGARSLDCMATGSYNIAMGFRAGRQQGCLSNSSLNDHCYDIYLGHTAGDNRCLLYTSPSPRDSSPSRMPSSA